MATRLANLDINQEKTGKVTIIKSWHVDTPAEVFSVIEATYLGYYRTGEVRARNWDANDLGQGLQVDVTFSGFNGEDTSFDQAVEDAVWRLTPTFAREPMEKHPRILELARDFAGEEDPDTGRIRFPRLLPDNTPGADAFRGLLGDGLIGTAFDIADEELRKNPLYGMDESGWLSLQGQASRRYLTTDVSQVMRGIGQILAELPSGAPEFELEGDRNWLKMPPDVEEVVRENAGRRVYQVDEGYLLSPIGGWPEAVYEFIEQ